MSFLGNLWSWFLMVVSFLSLSLFSLLHYWRVNFIWLILLFPMLFFNFFNFSFLKITPINFFLCFLVVWLMYALYKMNQKYLNMYMFFMALFLLCFLTKKFLMFFILFELSLFPTYLLVVQGSTVERSFAGNYLILYTFLGGLPLFMSMMYIFQLSSLFFYFFTQSMFDIPMFLMMLAFLMKLPIFFFHLWLPKAHVEASTEGSMMLAGVLLKLGSYGLIIVSPFFLFNYYYLSIFVIFGGMYAGLFSFIQMDLKSLMAYSSMIHMSYIVYKSFGKFSLGLWASVLMSVGHGFMSAKMFYLLSFVYSVTGSRNLILLKSSLSKQFFYSFLLGICLILNSSAPFSMNFFSELLLFLTTLPHLKYFGFLSMFLVNVIGGLLSIFFFLMLHHGHYSKNSFYFYLHKYFISLFLSLLCLSSLVLINMF